MGFSSYLVGRPKMVYNATDDNSKQKSQIYTDGYYLLWEEIS